MNKLIGSVVFFVVFYLGVASAHSAESVQLTPQNVEKIGSSDFQISWAGQGTLICNGSASIPTFRVPDDLAFGQWLECHVALAEGRSNQIRILCNQSSCTAHVGRDNHEFAIEPNLSSGVEAPRLIVEQIVSEAPQGTPKRAIPDGYALQIAAGNDRAALEALVAEYRLEDVRIYPVQSAGDAYFVLIYGFYRSLASAKEAGNRLPPGLQKPWIRTTQGLKASIRPE